MLASTQANVDAYIDENHKTCSGQYPGQNSEWKGGDPMMHTDPYNTVAAIELIERAAHAVSRKWRKKSASLRRNADVVFFERFLQDTPIKEVSNLLGLSPTRVRQLEKQIRNVLQKALADEAPA